MNIKFQDYLAERAWHDTMRFSTKNREELSGFIENFLAGAWSDTNSPIETYPDRPDYPNWSNQGGHRITELTIAFCPNDGTCFSHLYDYVLAYEFDWAVRQWETDKYGFPNGEPSFLINGGLINHARHRLGSGVMDHVKNNQEPEWSSHT